MVQNSLWDLGWSTFKLIFFFDCRIFRAFYLRTCITNLPEIDGLTASLQTTWPRASRRGTPSSSSLKQCTVEHSLLNMDINKINPLEANKNPRVAPRHCFKSATFEHIGQWLFRRALSYQFMSLSLLVGKSRPQIKALEWAVLGAERRRCKN